MRSEDYDHIAQCCHSLIGLVQGPDGKSQREFTEDEFQRFIDRLVWAIGASLGGRITDEQRAALHQKVMDTLSSCARVSNPNDVISERLIELFEETLLSQERAPLQFDAFVRRCRGASA